MKIIKQQNIHERSRFIVSIYMNIFWKGIVSTVCDEVLNVFSNVISSQDTLN